jgi:alpha-galactosidase
MKSIQRMFLRKSLTFFFIFLVVASFWGFTTNQHVSLAHASTLHVAENNGAAPTPFMGWSTWDFDGYYPTESNVEAQANVEASKLKAYGYNYVLLDDFWYLNPSTTVNANGYWVPNSSQFPNGLSGLASYVHNLGLKVGFYLTPGIPVAAVNQNTPIVGTTYHARDIANTSQYETNYNYGNGVMYAIDYSKPGAQAYINGWADELASWGADFLKVDGVGDGDVGDVQAWSQALQQSGRSIVFDISNSLDVNNAHTWQQYTNAWRIDGDVECYCSTQVTWNSMVGRFHDAPAWTQYAGPNAWNDLDALQISDGSKDGITNDERQTYMTLWAIEAAPLYAGDDLTSMDSYGLSLLTNTEVVGIDQAGHAAHPVSQASNQQVWFANNGNGSYTVALFNLGGSSANVTANWSDLGFSGSATVRDLWSHSNLGTFNGSFSATLNTHASRLFTVTPTSGGSGYYKIINRNSGQALDISGASTANGALAIQWPYQSGYNQQWQEISTNGGYKLVNRNSGKLLDDTNWSTTWGTQQDQWSDGNAANQWWNIVSAGNGYYYLVNQFSGLYADVAGSSTANGASVVQWGSTGGTNQQWQILPA